MLALPLFSVELIVLDHIYTQWVQLFVWSTTNKISSMVSLTFSCTGLSTWFNRHTAICHNGFWVPCCNVSFWIKVQRRPDGKCHSIFETLNTIVSLEWNCFVACFVQVKQDDPHSYMFLWKKLKTFFLFNTDLNYRKFSIAQREEGIQLVSEAICAGIFNDLGSGSNVDVWVITKVCLYLTKAAFD